MGWEMVKLGDVCEVVSGGTPKTSVPEYWGNEIVWVTPKDLAGLQGIAITDSEKMLSQEGLNRSSAKPLPAGTVVMSSRAPIGYVGVLQVPGSTNQGCKNFIPSDRIDTNYLAFFLRSNTVMLQQMGTGATFKEISAKRAADIPVPLPPLEEQQRIAKILNSVEDQVTNVHRQKSLASTLQVSFFEACTNSNSTLKSLGDSGLQVITGKSLTAKGNDASPDSFVIKVSAVSSGIFDASEIKPLPASYTPNPDHLIHEGDLLFARASGSPSLLGAVAIAPATKRNLYLPDKVWKISCPNIPNAVLHTALQTQRFRRHVESNASGASGVMNVRRTTLSEFEIPQLNEIEAFELNSQLLQIDNLASSLTKKAMLLNELYTSLSSRAFAGEL